MSTQRTWPYHLSNIVEECCKDLVLHGTDCTALFVLSAALPVLCTVSQRTALVCRLLFVLSVLDWLVISTQSNFQKVPTCTGKSTRVTRGTFRCLSDGYFRTDVAFTGRGAVVCDCCWGAGVGVGSTLSVSYQATVCGYILKCVQ